MILNLNAQMANTVGRHFNKTTQHNVQFFVFFVFLQIQFLFKVACVYKIMHYMFCYVYINKCVLGDNRPITCRKISFKEKKVSHPTDHTDMF